MKHEIVIREKIEASEDLCAHTEHVIAEGNSSLVFKGQLRLTECKAFHDFLQDKICGDA